MMRAVYFDHEEAAVGQIDDEVVAPGTIRGGDPHLSSRCGQARPDHQADHIRLGHRLAARLSIRDSCSQELCMAHDRRSIKAVEQLCRLRQPLLDHRDDQPCGRPRPAFGGSGLDCGSRRAVAPEPPHRDDIDLIERADAMANHSV